VKCYKSDVRKKTTFYKRSRIYCFAIVLVTECLLHTNLSNGTITHQQLFQIITDISWTSERSRISSGSIVSDYGLDDRAIGVRSHAGARDFSSSLCVQTGSGAHPASCTMGTGGPFPGGKSVDCSSKQYIDMTDSAQVSYARKICINDNLNHLCA
jgi:hypothetical protein